MSLRLNTRTMPLVMEIVCLGWLSMVSVLQALMRLNEAYTRNRNWPAFKPCSQSHTFTTYNESQFRVSFWIIQIQKCPVDELPMSTQPASKKSKIRSKAKSKVDPVLSQTATGGGSAPVEGGSSTLKPRIDNQVNAAIQVCHYLLEMFSVPLLHSHTTHWGQEAIFPVTKCWFYFEVWISFPWKLSNTLWWVCSGKK